MQECSGSDTAGRGKPGGIIKELGKRTKRAYGAAAILSLLAVSLILAGCGGGGNEGVSSQTVSGVASVGAPLAGQVTLRDASTPNREKTTMIAGDGSFAIDVTDMKGPFILRASGSANAGAHTMYSFTDKPGRANVNPFSSAVVASAAEINDPAEAYEHPDSATLEKIRTGLPDAIQELLEELKPLLRLYNADNTDPIRGMYKADHEGLDGVFDNVKITLSNGVLTIANAATGAVIFTGRVSDIKGGHFTDNDDDLPKPSAFPAVPAGVTATGGAGQVTIAWNAVSGATSYNIYWSTATGVTKANGTKITGATSPYVHAGLAAGTTYYYLVAAVNSAGEGTSSAEVSATVGGGTPASTPAAPTGVSATGGTKQVTLSWSAVSGATSYNLYWSTTAGVTTASGTKIPGVTSPAVHMGLTDGATYYYILTAVNGIGESIPSAQVSATTLTSAPGPTVPTAPTGVTATAGGTDRVTISWSGVSGATSYNLYWAATSGVTVATGTKVTGATSPYLHTGRAASTAYYYIVTAVNGAGESLPSAQASATTLTSAPSPTVPTAPTGVTAAAGGADRVTVSWTGVSGATSYNLYWATASGVTVAAGTKITGATSPYLHTGRTASTAYYYIVTAVNGVGESAASAQATATTNAPAPPPAPVCGTCHTIPPANGQHAFHVNSQGYSCSICHGTGYSATTVNAATHANGVINVVTTLNWNGTTCSPGCHGTRSW